MVDSELKQILSDNGFNYHQDDHYNVLVIENIEIAEIYHHIKYVAVQLSSFNRELFLIYINFEDKYDQEYISNLCINLSMYTLEHKDDIYYLRGIFDKDAFIKELHRLNSIGLNIKG